MASNSKCPPPTVPTVSVAVTAIQAPSSRGPEPTTERTLTQMAGVACNNGIKSDSEYKSFSGFAFVPQRLKQAHSMAHALVLFCECRAP
jgi:hypothetical protein